MVPTQAVRSPTHVFSPPPDIYHIILTVNNLAKPLEGSQSFKKHTSQNQSVPRQDPRPI